MGPPFGLLLDVAFRGCLKPLMAEEFWDGDGGGSLINFPQGVLDVGDDVS